MLKVNQLKELIRAVDKSRLTEFSIESDELKITMKKEAGQGAQPAQEVSLFDAEGEELLVEEAAGEPVETQEAALVSNQEQQIPEKSASGEKLHQIVAPMVGTFYRAPAPDADPYVKVGDRVSENTVVCIVEAMKLMNEIEAEVNGTIVEILVENGQLVEYGQPLFVVKLD